MSDPGLSYIAIAVRDVAAACGFFGDKLGLACSQVQTPTGQVPAFAVGATAIVVFSEDDAFLTHRRPGVDHIALNTTNQTDISSKLGLSLKEGPGIAGRMEARVDPNASVGVAVRLADSIGLAFEPGQHVERVDHIGIASADNRKAEGVFAEGIGCPVESRQTDMEVRTIVESFTSDTYGVVYHSREPEPVGGLRVSFLTVGDTELEFLEEFDASHGRNVNHGAAGTTRQDQGAIGRYIEKRGAGLHHIALKTDDIDRTLHHLEKEGCPLIDYRGRPGSRRGRIGFVHPKAVGGVLIHFVER